MGKVCFIKGTNTPPETLLDAAVPFLCSTIGSQHPEESLSALSHDQKPESYFQHEPALKRKAQQTAEAFSLTALTKGEQQNPGSLLPLPGSEKGTISSRRRSRRRSRAHSRRSAAQRRARGGMAPGDVAKCCSVHELKGIGTGKNPT